MASKSHIAITREKAYQSLRESTQELAATLGIDAPDFDIHKRYSIEYRQAQELDRIAAFLQSVVAKIEPATQSSAKRKVAK